VSIGAKNVRETAETAKTVEKRSRNGLNAQVGFSPSWINWFFWLNLVFWFNLGFITLEGVV